MPAINTRAVVLNDAISHIAKRSNWAGHEAGVIVVFCIVFIVAVALTGLFISKKVKAKRERNAAKASRG
jgi:hypothetical protein